MTARRPTLLVLRAIGLGDHLTGIPALRALRRGFPDHDLVLAAPEVLRPLVALDAAVDRLLPTNELCAVPWTGPPPDLAVDLHGNGPASRVLLEALGPRRLLAYAGGGVRWDPDEHERRRWCRLVTQGLGIESDPDDLLLARPASRLRAGVVVVHPGAASASRRWPAERFAEVAAVLSEAGHEVVITGTGAEAALVDRVRREAGLPRDADLSGRTDLAALAAVVSSARLVVAGDTGTAHLASAYRTPSVLLFGPTPPSRWGPPRAGPHVVLWHGAGRARSGGGDPHGSEPDPALLEITVPEVARAALGQLVPSPSEPGRAPAAAPGPPPAPRVAVP